MRTTPFIAAQKGIVETALYHTQDAGRDVKGARAWFAKRGMWACRDEWKGGAVT